MTKLSLFRSKNMAEVKPSALANSVMGKLYDVLTGGDETVPKSEDNFFTWCTPGIPVDPLDFEFLKQGLTAPATPDGAHHRAARPVAGPGHTQDVHASRGPGPARRLRPGRHPGEQ